mmetsp:Transcript_44409/g.141492  ORF Transcript_44409/g.141492 Transcript_44409/m.141492 type:complete len:264 (-) Transcript_44409:166-957(-)
MFDAHRSRVSVIVCCARRGASASAAWRWPRPPSAAVSATWPRRQTTSSSWMPHPLVPLQKAPAPPGVMPTTRRRPMHFAQFSCWANAATRAAARRAASASSRRSSARSRRAGRSSTAKSRTSAAGRRPRSSRSCAWSTSWTARRRRCRWRSARWSGATRSCSRRSSSSGRSRRARRSARPRRWASPTRRRSGRSCWNENASLSSRTSTSPGCSMCCGSTAASSLRRTRRLHFDDTVSDFPHTLMPSPLVRTAQCILLGTPRRS